MTLVDELRVQQERQLGPRGNSTYLSELNQRAAEDIERLQRAGDALIKAANLVSMQFDDGGVTEGAHMQMARATSHMVHMLALSHHDK